MKIFLTGGAGGIGQATWRLFEQAGHAIVAPSRKEFDITDFAMIDQLDLSCYDVLINCAGANQGAYLGWHNNSWQNQSTHVAVNFTGPLFLAKQYTRCRTHGQFVYITSTSADDPCSYTIFMIGSKGALRYSLSAVQQDYPDILFTEIVPGKTRTNMLKQNYQNTLTDQQIDQMYRQTPCLTAEEVAQTILKAVNNRLPKITICPPTPKTD